MVKPREATSCLHAIAVDRDAIDADIDAAANAAVIGLRLGDPLPFQSLPRPT
jgi:hypothetical protein